MPRKKLALDLAELRVQSFETAEAAAERGTVRGMATGQYGPLCASEDPNCTGLYGPACPSAEPNCDPIGTAVWGCQTGRCV